MSPASFSIFSPRIFPSFLSLYPASPFLSTLVSPPSLLGLTSYFQFTFNLYPSSPLGLLQPFASLSLSLLSAGFTFVFLTLLTPSFLPLSARIYFPFCLPSPHTVCLRR